ncbi:MAG: helix-turn-helix domain-containing protein, partial [Rhodobacteraceae bacterium]|nr:helix-turn-helix domain-containing protein [Paracoccaceae bacterium]
MTFVTHKEREPSVRDAEIARLASQTLAKYTTANKPLSLCINEPASNEKFDLPESTVKLLLVILEAIASGRGVTVIPENAELTVFQAADILNVSRPYFTKLLKNGAIPYRKVGKHMRILMEDVLA